MAPTDAVEALSDLRDLADYSDELAGNPRPGDRLGARVPICDQGLQRISIFALVGVVDLRHPLVAACALIVGRCQIRMQLACKTSVEGLQRKGRVEGRPRLLPRTVSGVGGGGIRGLASFGRRLLRGVIVRFASRPCLRDASPEFVEFSVPAPDHTQEYSASNTPSSPSKVENSSSRSTSSLSSCSECRPLSLQFEFFGASYPRRKRRPSPQVRDHVDP